METQLLRDQHTFPSTEVLKNALKDSYEVYEELIQTITNTQYGLTIEWNYYKDGKAWLCKVQYKKKTIFWLSVWDEFFKTGFYFTKKNSSGVVALDIKKSLKEKLISNKSIGKLIPLTIDLNKKAQLKDVLTIIEYKKSLK
jgi:hypothetical protein